MKAYVLDTNVILTDPDSLFVFEDNLIVLPLSVVNELDMVKTKSDEHARYARQFSRNLDALIKEYGMQSNMVKLNGSGGLLFLFDDSAYMQNVQSVDDALIYITKDIPTILKDEYGLNISKSVLVTNDINLRIKCQMKNTNVEQYLNNVAQNNFDPVEFITVDDTIIDSFYNDVGFIYANNNLKLYSYYVLTNGLGKSVLCKSIKHNNNTVLVKMNGEIDAFGIKPKNHEQYFLVNELLNPDIDLVVCNGLAGTGKTLLSIAAGLECIDNGLYDKMLILRSIVPFGRDIGYLKGDLYDKMRAWLSPFYDNLDYIFKDSKRNYELLIENGTIEIDALTYIRGRSLPNRFIILDECFPYNTKIVTDKGKCQIGSLCKMYDKGKELPQVLTFNEQTKDFEYKPVVSVVNKGKRSLIKLSFGKRRIKCTDDHPFLLLSGDWVKAIDLKIGDYIVAHAHNQKQYLNVLNDDMRDLVIGGILGNGCLQNYSNRRYRMTFTHSIQQEDYITWKYEMMCSDNDAQMKYIEHGGYAGKPLLTFNTSAFALDGDLTNPEWVIDNLNPKSLAVWFMDDGSSGKDNHAEIYSNSFDESFHIKAVKKLQDMGIDCAYSLTKKLDGREFYYIKFKKDGFIKLSEIIAPYVHESMEYKLHSQFRNKPKYNWNTNKPKYSAVVVDNIEYNVGVEDVFDIEVQDNHNFIVNTGNNSVNNLSGIVAHNCQNISPKEIKTIITRVGYNSKLILLGDIQQIDSPYLTKYSNALTYVMDRMSGLPNVSIMNLYRTERSRLAEQGIKFL